MSGTHDCMIASETVSSASVTRMWSFEENDAVLLCVDVMSAQYSGIYTHTRLILFYYI